MMMFSARSISAPSRSVSARTASQSGSDAKPFQIVSRSPGVPVEDVAKVFADGPMYVSRTRRG